MDHSVQPNKILLVFPVWLCDPYKKGNQRKIHVLQCMERPMVACFIRKYLTVLMKTHVLSCHTLTLTVKC